jgi:hypothetical protein
MIHVWIDGGHGRRHRHHGFDRIAAFGECGTSGFDRGMVWRADDTLAMSGGVEVHAISEFGGLRSYGCCDEFVAQAASLQQSVGCGQAAAECRVELGRIT